jgi:hypothetical protein
LRAPIRTELGLTFKTDLRRKVGEVLDHYPQTAIWPRIVSVYTVTQFLAAKFGQADIKTTCSLRKMTLSD